MGVKLEASSSFLINVVVSVLIFSSSTATAFNITKLLSNFPEFGAFNDYLSQTKLADQINRRQTITVLALQNDTVSAIAGKPLDVIKDILSVHVVLDYFGVPKLQRLVHEKKTSILTTLYQASGDAVNQQGFLNVTLVGTGEIAFGSGVKGSPLVAKLVKSVAAQPYNISVLEVSAPIVAPGVDPNPSPPPPPAPASTPPPSPADDEEDPAAEAPGPSDAPAYAPAADAPEADAPGPVRDGPNSSPQEPEDADGGEAEAPSAAKSESSRPGVGHAIGVGVLFGFFSLLAA